MNCLVITLAPRSCAEHKKRALKAIRERDLLQMGIFIPNCNEDGSYTGVQCTRNKFVCWCVDVNGVEIDRTRSSGRKPDCRCKFTLVCIFSVPHESFRKDCFK